MLNVIFSAPIPCPATHNFPFNGGHLCCKYFLKKLDPTANPLWDGSDLMQDDPAGSCHKDDFIPCPVVTPGEICELPVGGESKLLLFLVGLV